ncbi:MAG: hypothetical protein DYG92_07690 [Leptolyngbya sp. PLA1]|nr:hypothetical protein [Leptolyngbya sp. PLA1]
MTPPRAHARHILTDDAGTPLRVVRDRTDTGPLTGLARRLTTSLLPHALLAASLAPCAMTVPGLWLAYNGNRLRPGTQALLALALLLAIALVVWIARALAREWLLRLDWELASTRRNHGRCAGCGFDLAGAAPDPEGLAPCPECAHRWRTIPLTQSRPEGPPAPP